jgi:Amt family ammonium transporter
MHAARKAFGLVVLLSLMALWPTTALATGAPPAHWPGWHLQAAFLGLLVPLALILLAVGATPPEHATETAGTALIALVVGLVAYAACGFAFQFGGVGLQMGWPGLAGLSAEWSPLDPALGLGWGTLGLAGFFLAGPAATADAYALAAVQLPLVAMAVLIPVLGLSRRAGRGVLLLAAALTGGFLYPAVGNWVWGGGWLAMLGLNRGWGHGFVDLGGSATVHLLGASIVLAGMLTLGRQRPARRPPGYVELPPAHCPLFVLTGALLALTGWPGLVLANPLVTLDLSPGLVAMNLLLAALGGAAPGIFYSWLATDRIDPQLTARGLLAGLVAGSAGCGFVPPFASLTAGLVAGAILPFVLFWVEHGLHWHDPNATFVTHGVAGFLGTLWLALFADGRWGIGWNGVSAPLGQAQQGVAGLLVAPGYVSDVPGQLWAQLAGLAGIVIVALGLPSVVFALLRAVQRSSQETGPGRRPSVSRARK